MTSVRISSPPRLLPSGELFPSSTGLYPLPAEGAVPSDYLGHVKAWDITLDATPLDAADLRPSAGSVVIDAQRKQNSEFIQNDPIEVEADGAGVFSGSVIRTALKNPHEVGIESGTAFTQMVADRSVPAIAGGSPIAALDYIMQEIRGRRAGSDSPLIDDGVYWSLAGHDIGFDSAGNVAYGSNRDTSVIKTFGWDPEVLGLVRYPNYENSFSAASFTQSSISGSRALYCTAGVGSSLSPAEGARFSLSYTLAIAPGQVNEFGFVSGPFDSNTGTGKLLQVFVDYDAATLSLGGEYMPGGIFTPISVSQSIAGLNLDSEIRVVIEVEYPSTLSTIIRATVRNVGTASPTVTVSSGDLFAPIDEYAQPYIISGGAFRDLYYIPRANGVSAASVLANLQIAPISDYILVDPAITDLGLNVPIAGADIPLWDYLKMVCGALGMEVLANVGDRIHIRPMGLVIEDLDNYAPSVTRTISDQGAAQFIDFTNYDTELPFDTSIMYDAAVENKVFEIDEGGSATVLLNVTHFPTAVESPLPVNNQIGGFNVS